MATPEPQAISSVEPSALPRELAACLADQNHSQYSDADHDAWREVLGRTQWLAARWERCLPPVYSEGLRALDLAMEIPNLDHLNRRLADTGWTTVCVDGYIPSAAYVGFLARGIFPVSRSIRRRESADYSPTPDMAHDIVGHLPLLYSAEHRDFLGALGRVMVRATANALDQELYSANRAMASLKADPVSSPEAIRAAEQHVREVGSALASQSSTLTQLTRMYLWSIEFGLLETATGFSVHGAALLSSVAEMELVCSGRPVFAPYSIDVVHHDIVFSDLQRRYFVAQSYEQLHSVLADYEQMMDGG